MKKRWIALAGLGTVAAAGVAAVRYFPIQTYVLVDRITNPVSPSQPIAWQQGPARPTAEGRPPNIVLIVADDLGINDLSSTGTGPADGILKTPAIDEIGREGANFPLGYAANATCSPSRAALMTGRYPTRFGFEYTAVPVAFARNIAQSETGVPHPPVYHSEREKEMPPLADQGMPANEITLAETLKTRGYHTMHIGKWHLGEAKALRPEAQGFDESLGFISGASKYLPDGDPDVVNEKLPYDPIDRFLWSALTDSVQWNGGKRFHVPEYMTDYFAKQAASAIAANRNRPFFMYLAFNAPHTPFQAKREDYEALSDIKDHKARVYAAMIRALDRGVGTVMSALKANGLDDNTIVIFTSDNGGAWYTGLPHINAPYRGWKATFFEGGIRVPFFVRWPGHIAAGSRPAMVAHHMDVYATAVAAAGGTLPPDRKMDSVNLLPTLTNQAGAAQAPARTLFWKSGGYRVVRDGDWKLQVADRPARTWLFNLRADPTERVNLAAANPGEVQRLRGLLDAQARQMPKPLWPALIEDAVRVDVPLNAPWKPGQEYVYWSN